MKGWFARLVPPLRTPLTWRTAPRRLAVPIGFAAVFGGALAALVGAHVVHFSDPWWLLVLAITPWVWWMHEAGAARHGRVRGSLVLLARLAVVGLFAVVLARPHAVRRDDRLNVVYAIDTSHSVGESSVRRAIDYMLATTADKPATDAAGLVVFGREAGVELPPLESFPFEALNVQVPRDGTDIAKGLSLSAALCPDDRPARIVLVSDGASTGGDLPRVLDELASRGIAVDVVPIAYEHDDEVWVERLDVPVRVKRGETYEATAIVSALAPGTGTLTLRENGAVVAEVPIEWRAGKNRFALPIYLRQPGYYEYAATIEPAAGRDGWRENNTALNAVFLEGRGRVLVVIDPAGEPADSAHFIRALKQGERLVDVVEAPEMPDSTSALLPYHAIVFVNVPAEEISAAQRTAVHDAVFDLGTGFLMVGGDQSFGVGGYRNTSIATLLPVELDVSQRRIIPKGALAVVLHTCEFASGNTWAKRITKSALDVLTAADEFGVLAWDYEGGEAWIVELQEVGDPSQHYPAINSAMIGDMPSFAPTMRLALKSLQASDAATKHVIIISDGDPSPPPPALIEQYAAERISISTVTVFPHGGLDQNTMRNIARATGGRYYQPSSASALPRIFTKEAKTLARNMIVEQTVRPVFDFPSTALKGIGEVPPLHGFVLTAPKSRAEVALRTETADHVEPILAAWRYGMGRTAAFTSDLSARWGRDWLQWDRYRAFVNQLVSDVARANRQGDLTMRTHTTGDRGVIQVTDEARAGRTLAMQGIVRRPDGETIAVALEQTGPRTYRGVFPVEGRGRYRITVVGAGGGGAERAVGGLVVAYSPEYLRFRADPVALDTIARSTGGRVLAGNETSREIFPAERTRKRNARPVIDWVLLVLACLIPLDVALRRLQLEPRAWFRRERDSTGTLPTLLERKAMMGEKTEKAGAATRPVEQPAAQASPGPAPEAPPKAASPADDRSTTERLLALKRKRQAERGADDEPR